MGQRNHKDDSVRPITLHSRDFEQLKRCAYHLLIVAQTFPNVETSLSDYTPAQQQAMIEKRLALQNIGTTLKETLDQIVQRPIPQKIEGMA